MILKRNGQISVMAILFLAVALILSLVALSSLSFFQHNTSRAVFSEEAFQLAEAGVDKAIYQLNQTGGTYTGETDTSLGSGVFSVTVTDLSLNNKLITSTGYVPTSTNYKAKKTVSVQTNPSSQNVQFRYGVQVGYGGLSMDNNAVVNGNVFSNGSIDGSNGAVIAGDAWVAGGTSVSADQENINQSQDQIVGQNSSNANAAQSFTPSATNLINKVSLYIKKTSTPSDAAVLILTDNGGSPSKTSLSSGSLKASTVTGTYGWVEVAFSTPVQLLSGITYWLTLDPSVNSSKYYVWGTSDDSAYTLGTGKLSSDWNASSPSWIGTGKDFTFKTFMGGGSSHIDSIRVGTDVHSNTISNSSVGRDAYYQTISGTTVSGTSYPGSPDPGPQDMPLSQANIDQFNTDAQEGGTQVGDVNIVGGASSSLGPKKVQGNLTTTNNARLTITGTVYVTGDINLSNNCIIELDSGYGANSGVLIADGKVNISNNCILRGSGNPSSYLIIISTNASQDSGSPAMSVANNAQNAILYTTAGMLSVSNNADLKEAIGQKLHLSNNASVTYESGLANVNFTSGPGAGYRVTPGTYKIN